MFQKLVKKYKLIIFLLVISLLLISFCIFINNINEYLFTAQITKSVNFSNETTRIYKEVIYYILKTFNLILGKTLEKLQEIYLQLVAQDSFRKSSYFWQTFVITFSNLGDSLWYLIIYFPIYFLYSISIVPLIQSLLFGFNNIFNTNPLFLYAFISSIIFYFVMIFLNLLFVVRSRTIKDRNSNFKNIFKGFVFLFGIIIIPLFFLILNNIIFLLLRLILDSINANLYFSPTLLIMNSSYFIGTLYSIPFVPIDPITGTLILSSNFSYFIFWIGVGVLFTFEFICLIFIFKRLFTILYLFIVSPFTLVKDTIDSNNTSIKKWINQIVKEFFSIIVLSFVFALFLLSLGTIKEIFSPLYNEIPFKIISFIIFNLSLVIIIILISSYKKIFNNIFLKNNIKIEGKITKTSLEDETLILDSKNIKEIKNSFSTQINTQSKNISKIINKNIDIEKNKMIEKRILELNFNNSRGVE